MAWEWMGWEWMDWVVRGLMGAGFVIGAVYGAWELGVRKGRDVERRGHGKTRMSLEEIGEIFFSGLGGEPAAVSQEGQTLLWTSRPPVSPPWLDMGHPNMDLIPLLSRQRLRPCPSHS